jgi:hypothetical protein
LEKSTCMTCGKALPKKNSKFCNRECYAEGYRKGVITNRGFFKKGIPSINKGRTLESWVGEEKAADIRARMSRNSKAKGKFLRELNARPDVLEKRRISRWFHEGVVEGLVQELRTEGWRCYILSEYVKEKRTPDAILFNGKEMIALEVELQKRWKPSEESMVRRLSDLNQASEFFDRTTVVFPKETAELDQVIPALLEKIRGPGPGSGEKD